MKLDEQELTIQTQLLEDNAKSITNVVRNVVTKYTKELDDYVAKVKEGLLDTEHPLTNNELSNVCMRLSTYIYFASEMSEHLGIKDDISKALYKEAYNTNRNLLEKGTVADKNTQAELNSQQEYLVNIVYSRSFKIVKAKVDAAQELLSSAKKVLTLRMNEMNITRMSD